MNKLLFFIVSTSILLSCKSKNDTPVRKQTTIKTTDSEAKKLILEPVDENLNTIASFLAGNQPKNIGIYASVFKSSNWKAHESILNTNWDKVIKNTINPIRIWSKEEKIEKKSKKLFYPFSGADFLYVYAANPDYDSYYLFGLEPVGEIPKKENISNTALTPNILNAAYKSVDENMNHSFFHTKYMAVEFNNPILKGTIPIFMFFMNRMGVELTSIKPIGFNSSGEIEELEEFAQGVRIRFLDNGKTKELIYFSQDISDGQLKSNIGLNKMLNNVSAEATTMIKSASYICHDPRFSEIRDLIISKSHSIMQDDTGVPYRFFTQDKWTIRHYGNYTKPITIFTKYMQTDLKKATEGNEKPLLFRYGYNNPPNLMIATKKS